MPSKSSREPGGKLERGIEESAAICTLLPLRILPSGSRLALKDYRESWLLAFLRAENSISRVILSTLRGGTDEGRRATVVSDCCADR